MQFKTKRGLVDIPNEEVLAAADAIRGVLQHRAEVIVNGACVGVDYKAGEMVCHLVHRAFVAAKYPFHASWALRDSEGYEIFGSEKMEPSEERFRKSLYLNPPAGVGA